MSKLYSTYTCHSTISILLTKLITGGMFFIFPFFNPFFLLMFSLFSCPPSSSLSFLWRSITPHHLDPPFFSLHLSFVYLLIPVSASRGQSEDVCAQQKKMMSSLSAPAGRTGAITQLILWCTRCRLLSRQAASVTQSRRHSVCHLSCLHLRYFSSTLIHSNLR